jgi:hypothetical protein
MKIHCIENLKVLGQLIKQLSNKQYSQCLEWLSEATIGQHTRHILEFYLLLLESDTNGNLNYDNRKRAYALENSPNAAVVAIESICDQLKELASNHKLQVEITPTIQKEEKTHRLCVESCYERELAYCLDHSIHHQALIKIGLKELQLLDLIDGHFGLAASTIRNQEQQIK